VTYRQILAATEHRVVAVKIVGPDDPASEVANSSILGKTFRIVEPTISLDVSRHEVHQRMRRVIVRELPILSWRLSGHDFDHAHLRQHFSCMLVESITPE